MKTDRGVEARRSLPTCTPRLSTNIRETPYPRSPLSGSVSARYPLSERHWTERNLAKIDKQRLMHFLDIQMIEKEERQRELLETERKGDLEALARWKAEVAAEKQKELSEKERKRQTRISLEKEYARQYKERVRMATKEREDDVAHVRVLVKQAQDDALHQRYEKQNYRRMFQDLILVNEQQKQRAVVAHEAELRQDAQLQRELAQKLAAQDEARQKALTDRVLKQQVFLGGKVAGGGGRRRNQELYRRILDKQVREHRLRDWETWKS